jgi:hypothetical protein
MGIDDIQPAVLDGYDATMSTRSGCSEAALGTLSPPSTASITV